MAPLHIYFFAGDVGLSGALVVEWTPFVLGLNHMGSTLYEENGIMVC